MSVTLPKNINIGLPPQVKSNRNSLMEAFLLIVVCGLVVWFVILPKKSAVDAQQTQLDQYKKDAAKTADNLKTLQTRIQELRNKPDEVKRLDYAMPLVPGKTIDLEILIRTLANQSGVTVGDVNLSGKSEA